MQRSHTCSFRVIAHYLNKMFQDLIHVFFRWLLSPNLIKTLSTNNNWWKVMKSDLGPFGNLERTSGNQQDKIVLLFIIGKKRANPICFDSMSVIWLSVSKYCIHINIFHRHTFSLTSVNGPRRIQEDLQSITHKGFR